MTVAWRDFICRCDEHTGIGFTVRSLTHQGAAEQYAHSIAVLYALDHGEELTVTVDTPEKKMRFCCRVIEPGIVVRQIADE